MIRKYHNRKPQTTKWHLEEEPLNHHETPGRQSKQSNQLSLLHQDNCNTRMDIKLRTTKHRTITDSHNGSNIKQKVNNNRTTALERTIALSLFWGCGSSCPDPEISIRVEVLIRLAFQTSRHFTEGRAYMYLLRVAIGPKGPIAYRRGDLTRISKKPNVHIWSSRVGVGTGAPTPLPLDPHIQLVVCLLYSCLYMCRLVCLCSRVSSSWYPRFGCGLWLWYTQKKQLKDIKILLTW